MKIHYAKKASRRSVLKFGGAAVAAAVLGPESTFAEDKALETYRSKWIWGGN